MGYVLQHIQTGKYVAPPEEEEFYTTRIENARVFRTKQEADRERCIESERIVSLGELFDSHAR